MKQKQEIAKAVQRVLSAEQVEILVAGRAPLSERSSLRFVADQAAKKKRVGFEVDGLPEKYAVKGGLDGDELDDVFRSAAGERGELEAKKAIHRWAKGERADTVPGLPSWVAQAIARPVTAQAALDLAESFRDGRVRTFAEARGGLPNTQQADRAARR
ncbi:hypothetical protein P9281_34745 [Caballeronia sp. LP003]|uniref:hypothetical protein n=1 Tax=Caballeronia sp. LP003 TaxID=3038551 RepID=UPI00286564FE|nr:hypothetical protein [Caballeronia sp. LP003]MDR5791708.1 hypothetical protein [Caballeronia sp. LP003]